MSFWDYMQSKAISLCMGGIGIFYLTLILSNGGNPSKLRRELRRADNLTETKVEPDKDKDRLIYKIEFKTENGKYEYKINAVSGALLEAEVH